MGLWLSSFIRCRGFRTRHLEKFPPATAVGGVSGGQARREPIERLVRRKGLFEGSVPGEWSDAAPIRRVRVRHGPPHGAETDGVRPGRAHLEEFMPRPAERETDILARAATHGMVFLAKVCPRYAFGDAEPVGILRGEG
jgi:hypothetical protein